MVILRDVVLSVLDLIEDCFWVVLVLSVVILMILRHDFVSITGHFYIEKRLASVFIWFMQNCKERQNWEKNNFRVEGNFDVAIVFPIGFCFIWMLMHWVIDTFRCIQFFEDMYFFVSWEFCGEGLLTEELLSLLKIHTTNGL